MQEINVYDINKEAIHNELDIALGDVPGFGSIEFRITFQDSLPVRIDKIVTKATRIRGQH